MYPIIHQIHLTIIFLIIFRIYKFYSLNNVFVFCQLFKVMLFKCIQNEYGLLQRLNHRFKNTSLLINYPFRMIFTSQGEWDCRTDCFPPCFSFDFLVEFSRSCFYSNAMDTDSAGSPCPPYHPYIIILRTNSIIHLYKSKDSEKLQNYFECLLQNIRFFIQIMEIFSV